MRKLWDEFFYIPKHGKIREKVMLIRTAITIGVMVLCLAAMGSTAFAYFSHNVTSGINVIKAANFDADLSITVNDPNGKQPKISKADHKLYATELEGGAEYTVVLKPDGTANTGFFVITADGCNKTYHTQQLGADKSAEGGQTPQITFTLSVSHKTTVYWLSHWGTSSHYSDYQNAGDELYITQDEEIHIDTSGVTVPSVDPPTKDHTTSTNSTTASATTGTSAPTSRTETTTSTSTEPTVTEPTVTEPTVTEPTVTETAATESTDTTESTETQPTTETTEPIGTHTTEASE